MLMGHTRRKHRRIARGYLYARNLAHVFDHEATVLIQELYRYGKGGMVPVDPQPHAGRCSLNNMLTIVNGTRTDNIEHPLVGHALRLSREFMSVPSPNFNADARILADICTNP